MERARRATHADAECLGELWRQAADETRRLRGGPLLLVPLGESPIEMWMAEAHGAGDRLLGIGETGGVAVGFVSARCEDTALGRLGTVEAIYVEPEARQVGVGEAIMGLVLEWCEERDCDEVDAPALPGSRAAKAFFEGHGFTARLLVMHRTLSRPRRDG